MQSCITCTVYIHYYRVFLEKSVVIAKSVRGSCFVYAYLHQLTVLLFVHYIIVTLTLSEKYFFLFTIDTILYQIALQSCTCTCSPYVHTHNTLTEAILTACCKRNSALIKVYMYNNIGSSMQVPNYCTICIFHDEGQLLLQRIKLYPKWMGLMIMVIVVLAGKT